jgi:peroxiredoxin
LAAALLVTLVVVSSGCLQDDGPNGNGNGGPHLGATEGFQMYDLQWEDHQGSEGSLRLLMADFVIVHVVAPNEPPFMPQFTQIKEARAHFDNITVKAVTLRETEFVSGVTVADLRDSSGAEWTFAVPSSGLRNTLSIVDYPTVFLLDSDGVILVRNDDILGQGRMVEVIEETWGIEPRADVMPAVGDVAPELVWRDIDGAEGTLSDLRGSPVIVKVWEIECPFCLELFNEMNKIYANYSDDGLEIVSLDLITWETDEQVRAIKEEYNATWIFAVDGDNIQSRYDIWRLPLTLLLDEEGVVQWSFTGYVHSSVIAEQVEKLI